jgi:hypothetical protein
MRNRRDVLVGLMLALGGPAFVASCDNASDDEVLAAIRPNGRLQYFKRKEFRTIGVIADAIIPRTDTPGALDAQVPAYLDAMMNTWASEETKTQGRDTVEAISEKLNELGEGEFLRLLPAQRVAVLAQLDAFAYGPGYNDPVAAQYRQLKQTIASVYYWSEPGATQELQYTLVPGRWVADAPLSEIGRTWAE